MRLIVKKWRGDRLERQNVRHVSVEIPEDKSHADLRTVRLKGKVSCQMRIVVEFFFLRGVSALSERQKLDSQIKGGRGRMTFVLEEISLVERTQHNSCHRRMPQRRENNSEVKVEEGTQAELEVCGPLFHRFPPACLGDYYSRGVRLKIVRFNFQFHGGGWGNTTASHQTFLSAKRRWSPP